MLRVGFFKIRPDKVDRLRDWMHELTQRRDEVVETFRAESTQQESAYLLQGASGPVLVYVQQVDDPERAPSIRGFSASDRPRAQAGNGGSARRPCRNGASVRHQRRGQLTTTPRLLRRAANEAGGHRGQASAITQARVTAAATGQRSILVRGQAAPALREPLRAHHRHLPGRPPPGRRLPVRPRHHHRGRHPRRPGGVHGPPAAAVLGRSG